MTKKTLKDHMADAQRGESDELSDVLPKVLADRPTLASETPKRARAWEDRERAAGRVPVSFRHIPVLLRDEIKTIAAARGLRVGEVARLFLEHGLAAFTAGELPIEPVVEDGRLTLYPGEQDGEK